MSFLVKDIKFVNFRNYECFSLTLSESLTIISGPNGSGKTNIVEAIQLLCEGESFRKPSWAEVISFNHEKAAIELLAHDGKRLREVSCTFKDNKRAYVVNNKAIRGGKEIVGVIPVVLFTPDNLSLIKNSAETRRNQLDELGSQLSKNYKQLKDEYQKVVVQRNRLLRDGYPQDEVFSAWTEQLARIGSALYEHRIKLLNRITPHFLEAYERLDSENKPDIDYLYSWTGESDKRYKSAKNKHLENIEQDILKTISIKKNEELSRKISVCGPHRDDILFSINGNDARLYASQGQQRSLALAWKLAEVEVVKDITGSYPILLLDDVMSELDESRRQALASITLSSIQTVITTANKGYFSNELLEKALLVEIDDLKRCTNG